MNFKLGFYEFIRFFSNIVNLGSLFLFYGWEYGGLWRLWFVLYCIVCCWRESVFYIFDIFSIFGLYFALVVVLVIVTVVGGVRFDFNVLGFLG